MFILSFAFINIKLRKQTPAFIISKFHLRPKNFVKRIGNYWVNLHVDNYKMAKELKPLIKQTIKFWLASLLANSYTFILSNK